MFGRFLYFFYDVFFLCISLHSSVQVLSVSLRFSLYLSISPYIYVRLPLTLISTVYLSLYLCLAISLSTDGAREHVAFVGTWDGLLLFVTCDLACKKKHYEERSPHFFELLGLTHVKEQRCLDHHGCRALRKCKPHAFLLLNYA